MTSFTRALCDVEPIGATIASIVAALAFPAGTPIVQEAKLAADAICEQVKAVRASRRALGVIVAPDGQPAVSYGPKLINGKVIDILVKR